LYALSLIRWRARSVFALGTAFAATALLGALLVGMDSTREYANRILPSLESGRSGGSFSTAAPALPSDSPLPGWLRPPAPGWSSFGGSYSILNPDMWSSLGLPLAGRSGVAAALLGASTLLILLGAGRRSSARRPAVSIGWATLIATGLALLLPPIVWTMQLNLVLIGAVSLLAIDQVEPLGRVSWYCWIGWLACDALVPYWPGGLAWMVVVTANLAALSAALIHYSRPGPTLVEYEPVI